MECVVDTMGSSIRITWGLPCWQVDTAFSSFHGSRSHSTRRCYTAKGYIDLGVKLTLAWRLNFIFSLGVSSNTMQGHLHGYTLPFPFSLIIILHTRLQLQYALGYCYHGNFHV